MLPRQNRLRSSGSFREVYQKGRSWADPAAVLYTFPRPSPETRIGFSASRKLGGAVVRNRIRRRARAICRQLLPRLLPGADLIFVLRHAALDASPDALAAALERLLQRAGALRAPGADDSDEPYAWPANSKPRPEREARRRR